MDAYPMIEACFKHQQGPCSYISELFEGTNVGPNLLLDSGERQSYLMIIKYTTDDMLDHAKAQMDRVTINANNEIVRAYAGD